jgi:hypothetical protein
MSQKDKEEYTKHVNLLIKQVLLAAKKTRDDAGYSGRHDDGGASRMEAEVLFYKYGRNGTIPPEWKKYEVELDPEYEQYQRLKQKFGNK